MYVCKISARSKSLGIRYFTASSLHVTSTKGFDSTTSKLNSTDQELLYS